MLFTKNHFHSGVSWAVRALLSVPCLLSQHKFSTFFTELSGFVVSHSLLASSTGHCNVALIPEIEFSMTGWERSRWTMEWRVTQTSWSAIG
jgi:hypothetical protein